MMLEGRARFMGGATLVVMALGATSCGTSDGSGGPDDRSSDLRETEVAATLGGEAPGAERIEAVDAPSEETAPTPDVANGVTIPAGTIIFASLESTLSAGTHRAGDPFEASVTTEVFAADGMVLVPEGSRLVGTVRKALSTDGSAGALVMTFDAVWIEGVRHAIDANVVSMVAPDTESSGPGSPGAPESSGILALEPNSQDLSNARTLVAGGTEVVIRVENPTFLTRD